MQFQQAAALMDGIIKDIDAEIVELQEERQAFVTVRSSIAARESRSTHAKLQITGGELIIDNRNERQVPDGCTPGGACHVPHDLKGVDPNKGGTFIDPAGSSQPNLQHLAQQRG